MAVLKDDRLEADPADGFSCEPTCGVPVLEWVGDVAMAGGAVVVVVETAGVVALATAEAEEEMDAALVNEWNGFTYVNFGLEAGCGVVSLEDEGLATSRFGSTGLVSVATFSCLVSG